MKTLFYAINGEGLGHLTRLSTIGREMRRIGQAAGIRCDIQFVTTSDYPSVATDFPVFKVPSKRSIRRAGGSRNAFVSAAKVVICGVISSFRPDILVLDTQPQGAFNEFLFIRNFARKTVFINRHKTLPDSADEKLHRSHLPLYDLVLTPNQPGEFDGEVIDPRLVERHRHIGRIVNFDAHAAWTRARVRDFLGIPPKNRLVYVSAGGGGSREAEPQINTILDALATLEDTSVLVGYGPLYEGAKRYGPCLFPINDPNVSRFFPGLDLAISAAGYNTYEELLAARVPSLFFAQEKGMDRQDLRIERGLRSGWHGHLKSLQRGAIRSAVSNVWKRADPFPGLHQRPLPTGATNAATEILKQFNNETQPNSVEVSCSGRDIHHGS